MNEDRIVRMNCNSSPILIPEHVRYCRSVQSEPSAYDTHRHPSKWILVAALAALSRIKLGDVVSSIATARCEHVCWLATVATLEALGECGPGSRHQGVTSTADVLLLTLKHAHACCNTALACSTAAGRPREALMARRARFVYCCSVARI